MKHRCHCHRMGFFECEDRDLRPARLKPPGEYRWGKIPKGYGGRRVLICADCRDELSGGWQMKRSISLSQCPHGVFALCLDDENGGTKLVPAQCCGRWTVVKEWPVTAAALREIIITLDCAADALETAKEGEK